MKKIILIIISVAIVVFISLIAILDIYVFVRPGQCVVAAGTIAYRDKEHAGEEAGHPFLITSEDEVHIYEPPEVMKQPGDGYVCVGVCKPDEPATYVAYVLKSNVSFNPHRGLRQFFGPPKPPEPPADVRRSPIDGHPLPPPLPEQRNSLLN